jgi:hypothetical protein
MLTLVNRKQTQPRYKGIKSRTEAGVGMYVQKVLVEDVIVILYMPTGGKLYCGSIDLYEYKLLLLGRALHIMLRPYVHSFYTLRQVRLHS